MRLLKNSEINLHACLGGVGRGLSLIGDPEAFAAASEAERALAVNPGFTTTYPNEFVPHSVQEFLSCVVCTEKARDCVFLPCGHVASCMGCAQEIFRRSWANGELPKCPICRGDLAQSAPQQVRFA